MPFQELREDIQNASSPCRELDARIWCVEHKKDYDNRNSFSEEDKKALANCPKYTSSATELNKAIIESLGPIVSHECEQKEVLNTYVVTLTFEFTGEFTGFGDTCNLATCDAYIATLAELAQFDEED